MQKSGTSFAADPHAAPARSKASMQRRDNGLRFSPITLVLHWTVATLVMAIIVIGLVRFAAHGAALANLQNLLGAVLLPISVYRFWARITSYHPLAVGSPNPIEVIVSRSVAVGLALAMVLLPIAAWLSKSAAGVPIGLPGGFVIPALIEPDAQVAAVIGALYRVGGTAFLAGLALHVFGACKNHFVLKNDALKRMLGKHVEL